MAHFAQLDSNNIVLRVLVLDNSVMENSQGQRVEQIGVDFLQNLYGTDTFWKQTSYNTRGGIYYIPDTNTPDPDQSKALRANYAGIGYIFDAANNVFYSPKPEGDGWTISAPTWIWVNSNPQPISGSDTVVVLI